MARPRRRRHAVARLRGDLAQVTGDPGGRRGQEGRQAAQLTGEFRAELAELAELAESLVWPALLGRCLIVSRGYQYHPAV